VANNTDDLEDAFQNASESYDVGYCKPPRGTQFKKGTSGNPKGRPKTDRRHASNNLNFQQTFTEVFGTSISAMIDGKPQKINGIQAAMLQLKKLTSSGDLKALRLLVHLCKQFNLGQNPEGNVQLEGLFAALKAGPIETP
jgi:hypothetical protein